MFKLRKNVIPDDQLDGFREFISMGNARRTRAVLAILALIQALQLILYLVQPGSLMHDPGLMLLKVIIIVLSISFWELLLLLENGNFFLKKYSEVVIAGVVLITMIWSVANTFKAQSITSDISIYLLVIFATAAVVRMKPLTSALIFGVVYILFAVGIPNYQLNPTYQTSHIMNGLILNIAALLIASMMYRFSLEEYMDKQSISQKNKTLLHMASHDGLTGLYNHQAINELLEAAVSVLYEGSEQLSIMLIDLDYFKELNDTYGHKTGDAILKKMSEKIQRNTRSMDMAGRYGGDEFLIILPGSGVENTKEIAMRLLNEIRSLEYNDIKLSFSCGIAGWNHETADQLIEKADKVLYRVKNSGRNNISA